MRTETRPWGRFEVLYEDEQTWLKRITIAPGQSLSYQYHRQRTEFWLPETEGIHAIIGREEMELAYPTSIPYVVGVMTKHRLWNPCAHEVSLLEWVIAVEGTGKPSEDDIVRLDDNYGR